MLTLAQMGALGRFQRAHGMTYYKVEEWGDELRVYPIAKNGLTEEVTYFYRVDRIGNIWTRAGKRPDWDTEGVKLEVLRRVAV